MESTNTPKTPYIYAALNAIMGEIGHIGKDKKNTQQGFMFRGIDQVMNTLKPLLAKHEVVIIPEVIDTIREERMSASNRNLIYTMHKVRYHFTAADGSEVVAVVCGEGMDSADKSSNKALAVAFKYACFQVFCIPTEEMAKDDPDLYSPEDSQPAVYSHIAAATSTSDLMVIYNTLTESEKANKNIIAALSQRKNQLNNGTAQH